MIVEHDVCSGNRLRVVQNECVEDARVYGRFVRTMPFDRDNGGAKSTVTSACAQSKFDSLAHQCAQCAIVWTIGYGNITKRASLWLASTVAPNLNQSEHIACRRATMFRCVNDDERSSTCRAVESDVVGDVSDMLDNELIRRSRTRCRDE